MIGYIISGMQTPAELLTKVSCLWKDHQEAEFPARMRGVEFGQVDMVLLNTYIAGCVSSWIAGHGTLDAERYKVLGRCLADLDRVLHLVKDEQGATYYDRLRMMGRVAYSGRAARP